ncbi:MAG: ADOP family duplicated permease, partial [Thermoanaerobaculia bacterium]
LGRTWDAREEAAGGESRVVVLSHGLWRRHFGADPEVVGRTAELDGVPYTVIGVMPRGFHYPYDAELWRLWEFDPDEGSSHILNVQARLAPGVTLEEAQAELDLISERQAEAFPETSRGYRIAAQPTRENLIEGEDRLVLLLLAGVALVLLIAAANVVSLLMARTVARSRELAVRASLGASAWRRARQLTTENLVLALLGGAAGLAASAWLQQPLTALLPNHVREIFGEVPFDRSAVLFNVGLSVGVGVAVGLLAAWGARSIDLRGVLHGSAEGPRGVRILGSLVVVETALTVALLVGALFLSLDLHRLASRDPGFQMDGLVTAALSLPEERYESGPPRLAFEERAVERIRALPGVQEAAIVNLLPYADGNWGLPFRLEGEDLPPEQAHTASFRQATPGYFEALGVPVLRGRGFRDSDRSGSVPVAVVDRSFAERYWPDEDPVGQVIHAIRGSFDGRSFQVVGLVGDIEDPLRDPAETVFTPMAQTAIDSTAFDVVQPSLAVRTAGAEPTSVVPGVRSALEELDPGVPLFRIQTAPEALGEALAQQRTATVLALLFGGCGLLLAAVGTYGIVGYTVSRRVREFGVRMAMGASRGSVLRGVLVRGGRLVAIGIALGLVAALALSDLVAGSLQAMDPAAPAPYVTVAAALLLIGLAACLQPALRATRTDPAKTLREG